MEVAQALQDLPGVEDDGGLLQGPPLGAQQSGQAPWGPETQRFIQGSRVSSPGTGGLEFRLEQLSESEVEVSRFCFAVLIPNNTVGKSHCYLYSTLLIARPLNPMKDKDKLPAPGEKDT